MMWMTVIPAVVALLQGDATLTGLLGGAYIYRNRTRKSIQIPGVYWSVVHEGLEENLAPITVQLDVYAVSASQSSQIEQRIFQLLHSDVDTVIGGLAMWSQFTNRYDLHDENEGVDHTALEYQFHPPRYNG
jgi:hypothetical protein